MSLNLDCNLPSTLSNLKDDIIESLKRIDALANDIDGDLGPDYNAEAPPSGVIDTLFEVSTRVPILEKRIEKLNKRKKAFFQNISEGLTANNQNLSTLLCACGLPSKGDEESLIEDVIKFCSIFLFILSSRISFKNFFKIRIVIYRKKNYFFK